jgi:hypothetical protein
VAEPVALGLVDSLARIHQYRVGVGSKTVKRLELLKETVPKLSRVAVLRIK